VRGEVSYHNAMKKTLLLCALYLFGVGRVLADPMVLVTLPGKSHEIYSVSKDNKITLVQKLPGGVVEGTLEGSTAPLISPGGKKLAYLQGNNLFIKGLGKEATPQQVTKEGFSNSKKYRSVYPLLSGWSRDSSQVLYYLTHVEEGMEGEEEGPALGTKDLKYGYYFHDASAGVTYLPGMEGFAFCGWTVKKEALLLSPNQVLLYAVEAQGMPREIVFKYEGADAVAQVSPGLGTKALAVASSGPGKWSQVVELDLNDGTAKAISKQQGWADFNWPHFSPKGKKMAWIETERNDDGTMSQFLTVDRNAILDLKVAPRYEWLDETRIAVTQVDKTGKLELLVVDVPGGNTLARKGF
jgi:dipeptidyl aminopeptidase/acylaminoacyl peptidase